LGFAVGNPNLYGYVFNNPLSMADPTGLDPFLGNLVGSGSANVQSFSVIGPTQPLSMAAKTLDDKKDPDKPPMLQPGDDIGGTLTTYGAHPLGWMVISGHVVWVGIREGILIPCGNGIHWITNGRIGRNRPTYWQPGGIIDRHKRAQGAKKK